MNELEELEQEGLDEDLLQIGGTTSLPNVPSTELPAAPGKFWVTWIELAFAHMFPLINILKHLSTLGWIWCNFLCILRF